MSRKLAPFRTCNQCNQTKPVDQFHKYVQPRENGRTSCSYSAKCLACRAEIELERGVRKKAVSIAYQNRERVENRPYEHISDDLAEGYRWFIDREMPLPIRRGGQFICRLCGLNYDTIEQLIEHSAVHIKNREEVLMA